MRNVCEPAENTVELLAENQNVNSLKKLINIKCKQNSIEILTKH